MIGTRLGHAGIAVAIAMSSLHPAFAATPRHGYRDVTVHQPAFWQHPYDLLGRPVTWRVRYTPLVPLADFP